jgi:hypothetical protein
MLILHVPPPVVTAPVVHSALTGWDVLLLWTFIVIFIAVGHYLIGRK